ncbi:MAG: hypothetical protein HQK62_01515 [Desulfamplus sp.]|nr:hypothetical protein [Desulfamplus sp.]
MNKSLMNIFLWVSVSLLFATSALAGVNAKSQVSHAAGGALIAGVITGTVADVRSNPLK